MAVLFILVGEKRARLAERREIVDWIILRGRVLDEAALREWARVFEIPLDEPMPLLLARLAEYGWIVLQQLDPGPQHHPGSFFCPCWLCAERLAARRKDAGAAHPGGSEAHV